MDAKERKTKQSIQLLNVKELASKLRLSVRTVWRLNSAGHLPKTVSVGTNIRWKLSDIELWLTIDCPCQNEFDAMKGGAV